MRVLSGRAAYISHEFLDDETPISLAAVTVTVTDALGNVAASGAAAQANEVWTFTVPASVLALGVYAVTWDGTDAVDTTYFEVVGGYLFSVPEARASDDYLKDANEFPAADIAAMRETVEWEFQQITQRSFTPRAVAHTYTCDDYQATELTGLIPDARSIVSLSVNGTPVTDLSQYGVTPTGSIFIKGSNTYSPYDFLWGADGSPRPWHRGDVVTAVIAYGWITPPADVKRVGMVRLRHLLAAEASAIPDRATTWAPQEGGSFRLATPGLSGFKTGIPEVDATLANYNLDALLALYGIV